MSAAPKPLLAAERVRLYLTLVPYLLEHGQVSSPRPPRSSA